MLVGVSAYDKIDPLDGPLQDLDAMENLFSKNSERSVLSQDLVIRLDNPSCSEFRESLKEYVEASQKSDVLILYFSGHGSRVGNDFAFCLKDSDIYNDVVVPVTVVSFSEIIQTLELYDIIPIFIIDACYSGALAAIHPPQSTITSIKKEIGIVGGKYALLCSCNERQKTGDSSLGGDFSLSFIGSIVNHTYPKNKPHIYISDLEENLQKEIQLRSLGNSPKIVIGDSLPDVPLCRNLQFEVQRYGFVSLFPIMQLLWNNGSPLQMQNNDIHAELGFGAYGNKSKLGYGPWSLIEKISGGRGIRLSSNGIALMSGLVDIPVSIHKDPISEEYVPVPGTGRVTVRNGKLITV